MNESLHTALIKLRLSGLAQALDVRLQEAAGNHLQHAEFLELVLQDELAVRNERLIARRVFEIAMRRYQIRSTIMTSNRPLEDWGKLLGDVPAATAILDRFLHNAEVITITGKSYRLRNRSAKDQPLAEAAACTDEKK